MKRYVEVEREDGVLIELTPHEWAVALDVMETVHSDTANKYSPYNRAAIWRAVEKLRRGQEQVRQNALAQGITRASNGASSKS